MFEEEEEEEKEGEKEENIPNHYNVLNHNFFY